MNEVLSFPIEIKRLSERQFEGYGAVFGNVDAGNDLIIRGAFAQTLADHKVRGTMPLMFWAHDPSSVPGKWDEVREDEKGLYVKGTFANTQLGNESRELMMMKAVRGLSIGYRTIDREYNDDGVRILKAVDLWEVSIVSLAMNPLAEVTRSKSRLSDIGEFVPSERDLERIFRDLGMSKSVAKRVVRKVYADDRRDAGSSHTDDRRDAGINGSGRDAADVLREIERNSAALINAALG